MAVVDQPRHLVLAAGAQPCEEKPAVHDRQPLPFERGPALGVVIRIHGPQLPVKRFGEMLAAVRLTLELTIHSWAPRSRSDM